MSQALSGRRKSVNFNNRIASRLFSLCRCARLNRRVVNGLLLGLGLLCSAATTALAQQAQTVKSTQPIVCDGKNYQLRLVTAEAPIGTQNAKALGIVLTPQGATDSKVFALYWMDEKSVLPTHRDDTSGTLGATLMRYGTGLTNEKVPAVESFFTSLKCSPDPQVIGIQILLSSVSYAPTLREVAQNLKNVGVSVDDAQVENASAGEVVLFKELPTAIEFAKAVRQYVSSLLAAEGRNNDKAGHPKPSLEDQNKALSSRNADLENEVKAFRIEKASFLGGAPTWLIVLFGITLILLVVAVGKIVMTYLAGSDKSLQNNGEPPKKPTTEVLSEQAAKISTRLEEIISSASARALSLDGMGTNVSQTGEIRNQKAKGQQSTTDAILQRLTNNHIVRQQHLDQTRRLVGEVLGEAAAPWREAHIELQNELEEFHISLLLTDGAKPVPKSKAFSPGPAAVPGVPQEMTAELNKLVTDMSVLKSSVDGFDAKLVKYVDSNRALQNIWWHWYQKDYAGGQVDALATDLGEVIGLYRSLRKRCCKDGATVALTKKNILYAMDDLEYVRKTYLSNSLGDAALLHEITEKIKGRMADEADVVGKYKGIETALRNHFARDVKAHETVPRLITERSEACEKLRMYHPNQNFTQAIDAVVANYQATTDELNRALPSARGTMLEMVKSLAAEYQKLKPEAEKAQRLAVERDSFQQQLTTARTQLEAGKHLVEEIARQLNFQTDHLTEDEQAITGTLNKLTKERESSVYLQLRLGLSSALTALGKATSASGSAEQMEVIEALQLEKVKKGVKELLAEMEECSGEQLWTRGLSEGFSQKWLHYLIRADLLLRTYYSHQRDFGFLQQSVSLTCSVLLAALHELQVEVLKVGLFEPLPQEMETEPVYPGIRNLPAVREKVRLKLQNIQTGEVVVDVTSFPYFVKGIQENRGRASIANPSAWLQH